ncbi:hypothetical protein KKE78_02620 [Patescibacteria group bacterium]|nr:hypothetical protein [Patescibacteria group bacterium]
MSRKEVLSPRARIALAIFYFASAIGGGLYSETTTIPNPSPGVPRASLLRSGQPDSVEGVCGGNLPRLVLASKSSFFCSEEAQGLPPYLDITETPLQAEIIPLIPPPPTVQRQKLVTATHTVKPGDTFSEIIEKQFGSENAYDNLFAETVRQNTNWLANKSPEAQRAIKALEQYPDWTPKTNKAAWSLFMKAAGLIHPGDTVVLKMQDEAVEVQPEAKPAEEAKPAAEEKINKIYQKIAEPLPGFFGSGICNEQWGSQPPGNKVCETKHPYGQCVQLGSGETPSYTCAKTQIGGRFEKSVDELSNVVFVITECPKFDGSCVGYLKWIEDKNN